MKTKKTIVTIMAAALMIWAISSSGLAQTQEYHQTTEIADFQKERGGYSVTMTSTFKVSPGGDLRMEDLVGDVTIKGGNGKEVEIIEDFFDKLRSNGEFFNSDTSHRLAQFIRFREEHLVDGRCVEGALCKAFRKAPEPGDQASQSGSFRFGDVELKGFDRVG